MSKMKQDAKKYSVFLFFINFYFFNLSYNSNVMLICFSYNRPLQLFAFLESANKYIKNLDNINILYRADDTVCNKAYQEVQAYFKHVNFIRQASENARENFKPIVSDLLNNSISNYILFAVDDIIVKSEFDIDDCIKALEKYNAYGFYLRLGKNTDHSYYSFLDSKLNSYQILPYFKELEHNIYSWDLNNAQGDWGYPNTVDMTLYRKQDVILDLSKFYYTSPNTLEANWCGYSPDKSLGLCFSESKIFNIPINCVQVDCIYNRSMGYSPEELLNMFNQGFKIDISEFDNLQIKSAHTEYMPKLIYK